MLKPVVFIGLMLISFHSNSQDICTPDGVSTEIFINAPRSKIWSILTDVKDYPKWNPYIYEIKGDIKPGKFVKFRMKGNPKERKFAARIHEFQANSSFVWGGGILFFFNAKHYIILEKIDDTHTRLLQGESWTGLFGRSFGKTVYKD